ncbi:MAG TPA: ATP-binding cassette domain-containing protein [Chitinispirillaceae bacterium]|nr:ATP-binding cassette domain-containing protein [Chitinispirillaceae bacterium]
MTIDSTILNKPVSTLLSTYPVLESVLLELGIEVTSEQDSTLVSVLELYEITTREQLDSFVNQLQNRYNNLASLLSREFTVRQIEICAGTDKDGNAECVQSLMLQPGDLLSIVGPTGSGKSRLLADIEWLAHADTPSNRTVLLNGTTAEMMRAGAGYRGNLIAQLSQTMSFIMDSTVEELLQLHVESRGRERSLVAATIDAANELSGERFTKSTQLNSLSGGQTRALMVADTALISSSPIVLIDEIENAGIDRIKAFNLLTSNDKIVLLATHDPILALTAPRRLCMRNGSMHIIRYTTEQEHSILSKLEELDSIYMRIRHELRHDLPITPFDLTIKEKDQI